MHYRARLLLTLAALVVLLAGCWDRKEIEDVGFVLAMGLDKGQQKPVLLTVQIAIPRNISPSAGGGGGAGGSSKEKPPVLVESVEAESITEALRDLETLTSRRISFLHTMMVIFGRDLAQEGLGDHLGILTRNRQFRRGLMLLVADERASEVLTARPRLEENPAVFLEDLTRRAHERTARAPRVDLHRFLRSYESLAQEPVMPIVRLVSSKPGLEHETFRKARLTGTAIFHQGKMVGELDPDETEAFLLLTGETRALIETIPAANRTGQKIAMELTVEGASTQFALKGGRPSLNLLVTTEAEIREIQGQNPEIVTVAGLAELENRTSRQLTERANALVKKLQGEIGVDIVGFGHNVRARFIDWPSWEAYNWPKRFPEIPIQVTVRTMIRRVGMTFQPLEQH